MTETTTTSSASDTTTSRLPLVTLLMVIALWYVWGAGLVLLTVVS